MPDSEVLDPEVDEPSPMAITRLRHPGVPTTVNELAALGEAAHGVLSARIKVLNTARFEAIRMTHPEDWVLFKSPDERVTAYLQDAGCDRVRDILGIEIYNIATPERLPDVGDPFMYLIAGDGRCKMTQQIVESIEGGRQSTDDFCKDKTGAALELAVRKAARANLDGNIVRELAGLKTVPLDELKRAWEGQTGKTVDNCRKGRGFGTKQERHGGDNPDAPKLVPPNCGVCGKVGVYRTSAKGGFYGCPDFRKHEAQKWTVDAKEWEKDPRSKQAAAAAGSEAAPSEATKAQPQATTRDANPPLLTDNDIPWGGNRK